MVHFGSVAVFERNIPAADFAAEIMIAFEQSYAEPALREQGCRADAGQPATYDSNPFGRLNGFGSSRIGLVDDDTIAIEFASYPRLQKAFKDQCEILRARPIRCQLSGSLVAWWRTNSCTRRMARLTSNGWCSGSWSKAACSSSIIMTS
jgi:hypothetical protein